MGQQMADRPAAELAAMAGGDHLRTLGWLRAAEPAHLRRRCDMGNGSSMTAEEIIHLPLTTHLEEHVAQLEAALE